MSVPHGRKFWKMSGSGNDFVFFDARTDAPGVFSTPEVIDQLCARATGVGADGVVFIQDDATEAFRIRYFNRDGSLAELCGNASLCSARLATELGVADRAGFRFGTDAGVISARFVADEPEIDLQPVRGLRPDAALPLHAGERRIGFADTGVPHLVVLVDDAERVDVAARGRELRFDQSLADGANVNFVSQLDGGGWRMRTYERGVEAETLACGTGTAATGVLLECWGLSGPEAKVRSSSGRILTTTVGHAGAELRPSLRGEARVVFVGELAELSASSWY
ncbi:MAG: diaminopimelate epimerase [Gemmatimonadaceae bacterium]